MSNHYFWGIDPFSSYKYLRISVPGGVARQRRSRHTQSLPQWNNGGDSHGANLSTKKSFDVGFFLVPIYYKDALELDIDFMGPFPSSKGNKYILVAVDNLSKWVEAKTLPQQRRRVCLQEILKFSLPRFSALVHHSDLVNTLFAVNPICKGLLKIARVLLNRLSTVVSPADKWLVSRMSWIFEDSRARSFCPSITRALRPQLHFGNPISKS
ncbi:reverse transcriptase domain-containing protein [Tanacetum coccineum]